VFDQVQQFCGLLRKNGVRVSTPEVIDAVRAVEAVGISDGVRLRGAIKACVVKRPGDGRTFDELFDLFFLRGGALLSDHAPMSEMLRAAGLSQDALAAVIAALRDGAAEMTPMARAAVGMGSGDAAPMVRAAGLSAQLERMVSPLQVGYFTYRLLEQLDIDGAERELRALLERIGSVDEADREALDAIVRDGIRRLRDAVRDHVAGEFARQNLDYGAQIAAQVLADKPLSQLGERDVADLRREVTRLARVLRAKISLRPKLRRRGRLDVRRTLRKSLATGGVPFTLVRRTRELRKPRLLVLCDISDSVRNVSRFMLQFVYTLSELFDRVESYAFVSDIGELTDLFRSCDLDRAVELAYAGAVCNVFANSNYGRAFELFERRFLQKINRRTTVLVIGDGRNNFNPARAEIVAAMRRRAKQLWWLNPEPMAAWGFGDSAMREYEPHCDKVVVAYNLNSLKKVVDELVL
jgi:hypothetical protein